VIRRLAAGVLAVAALAACGSWQRVGSAPEAEQSQATTQLLELQSVFQKIGRLAASGAIPFVGSVATLAGPGDSALAIVAISMENRYFAFQKDTGGFAARYRVDVVAQRPAAVPLRASREEVVRVTSFKETLRNDESILFQRTLRLVPGTWRIAVTVHDLSAGRQSTADLQLVATGFGPGSVTAPILAYEVKGRARRTDPLSAILNPRGTVAYGGDSLLAYVEGYDMGGRTAIPFELRDDRDSIVLRDSIRFTGAREVEGQIIRLSPDSAPLGTLRLAVGVGAAQRSTNILVSLSSAWLVTNYEEMLSLLRFFGEDERLDQLRKAAPEDRPRLWREFYRDTDPNKLTPENEALNEYFGRIAIANVRFRDEGIAGWRTDRGEVFIGLGEPDESFDASATSQGRVIRWSYSQLRLTLYFQDESGFGRFRLTPASRADFDRVLARVRRQAQ
jgi:GWxTD domain-containing protein